jgi:RNA recognition motif-containing protein
MAKRLFVGSLAYSVTTAQVEELFATIGKVSTVNLITDKFSGQSKGFAFVEYVSDEDADKAIKELNGKDLEGRAIVVNEARPQENRTPRDNNNDSRGNFSRSNKRW